jgi:hypothetical protein
LAIEVRQSALLNVLRTRLALGGGDKGGEAFKLTAIKNPKIFGYKLISVSFPRHADDVVSGHRSASSAASDTLRLFRNAVHIFSSTVPSINMT